MDNNFKKFQIIVLAVLLVFLTGAAVYILQEKEVSPVPDVIGPQDRPGNAPASAPDTHVLSGPSLPDAIDDQGDGTGSSQAATEEPRQIPRHLTEAQQEENRRELARMAEELPDNMWVPRDPSPGFSPEQGEKLRKSIELSDKIRKGTASPAEEADYYAYKLKETRDKIELIRYIARRTEALSAETGKPYLSESDITKGFERIEELEQLAESWRRKLDALSPDAETDAAKDAL